MSYPVRPPKIAPIKNKKYVHYKTKDVYTVLSVSYNVINGDWIVTYRKGKAYSATPYSCPLNYWNEMIINDEGKWVKRFKYDTLIT